MTLYKNNVGCIRESRHITQTELANRIGVSCTHFNQIENWKRKLNMRLAARIANELNCSIEDLYKGGERMKDKPTVDLAVLLRKLSLTTIELRES